MNARKLLVILILILLAYLVWKYLLSSSQQGADAARGDSPELVLDRVWVDSNPEHHTDYVNVMLMLSDIPMGVFQKASAYRMTLEVFEFKRDGNQVGLRFPQSGDHKRFRYRIHHCDDLPPFDLCLDLTSNPWNGPKRYYSVSDGHAAEGLDRLEAELRGRIPAR